MKFTEKLILIPIERYNQLIRGTGEKKEGVLSESGEGKKEVLNVEDSLNSNKDKEQVIQNNKKIEEDNATPSHKGNLRDKIRKVSKRRKKRHSFPPPPPGIPNRVKKSDFKWLSPF